MLDLTLIDMNDELVTMRYGGDSFSGSSQGRFHNLMDLRLSALGLYAGQESQVEDFEAADGTTGGLLDSIGQESIESVGNTSAEITEMISSWWELVYFWPTLFISMNRTTDAATYDVLLTTDLLGNTQLQTMEVLCLAAEDLSDEELSEAADVNINAAVAGLAYVTQAILLVSLMFLLNTLRACSWSIPTFAVGIVVWWIMLGAYLALTDCLYCSGMETSIESFLAIMSLLLSLVLFSAFLPGLLSGFRLFWLVAVNPVVLGTLVLMAGLGEFATDIVIRGWNFLPTLSLALAVMILIWYAIHYFTLYLLWLFSG